MCLNTRGAWANNGSRSLAVAVPVRTLSNAAASIEGASDANQLADGRETFATAPLPVTSLGVGVQCRPQDVDLSIAGFFAGEFGVLCGLNLLNERFQFRRAIAVMVR